MFLQEMVMAIWLIAKGFSPSTIASESNRQPLADEMWPTSTTGKENTMKAIIQDRYGSPDDLRLKDVDTGGRDPGDASRAGRSVVVENLTRTFGPVM
ncbi:MAG: hypothetical protein IMZ75_15035, partial [Actinobacteria bacterium]|nr:hypothetical protein [Actinomycetota bacterium]